MSSIVIKVLPASAFLFSVGLAVLCNSGCSGDSMECYPGSPLHMSMYTSDSYGADLMTRICVTLTVNECMITFVWVSKYLKFKYYVYLRETFLI